MLSSLPELKQSIPGGGGGGQSHHHHIHHANNVTSGNGTNHHNNTVNGGKGAAGATGAGVAGGGSGAPGGVTSGSTSGTTAGAVVGGGGSTTSTTSGAGTCLTVGVGDVWTSPKLIDSGFSTETNKSSPTNKSDDDDPLYSLLDLIQLKVSSSCSNQQQQQLQPHSHCLHCSEQNNKYVPNGKRSDSHPQLGRLDHVLQFRPTEEDDDCSSQVIISRNIIGAVLREVDVVELQRQVLFGVARVKVRKSHNYHYLYSFSCSHRQGWISI